MPRGLSLAALKRNPKVTPKMIRLLKQIKPVLQNAHSRKNFMKALNVISKTKNRQKIRRKLGILGMDFLDESVPMLANPVFS